jgi:predicted AAA+ superfamily ATPase
MKKYNQRIVDTTVKEYLKIFGAVIVEGARATGKTTTAKHASKSDVSLDESPQMIAIAQASPSIVFEGDIPRLIDEWQLAPNIWNAVRHEVDKRSEPGQFILTGSATPNDDITRHSGGGRFGRLKMRPMSLFESGIGTNQIDFKMFFTKGGQFSAIGGPDIATYANRIILGGWPLTQGMTEKKAGIYLQNYIEDMAKVDVGGAHDTERIKSLIYSISRNIATEATVRHMAAEAGIFSPDMKHDTSPGVSVPTARKYLDSLTKIFILEELPPWSTHIRSKIRQRVSPKWHFADPSIAAATLGLSSKQLIDDPNTLGYFFESLCIRDLRIFAEALGGRVSYYRDEKHLEVDAIVQLFGGKWAAFEIKLGGDNFIEEGASNLKRLYEKLSESKQRDMTSLNVLTAGNVSYKRSDDVNVVALGHLGISPVRN